MLMRYQAALRSDRGGSTDTIDHNDTSLAVQLLTGRDIPTSRSRREELVE